MTVLEILLSVAAVGASFGGIAWTLHVVRNTPGFEQPTENEVRRMIETAPRGRFNNVTAL